MKYMIIEHSLTRIPKYQTRVIITRNDFYVHPKVFNLSEFDAVLDYFNATFEHKGHVYIGLLWLLEHSPVYADTALELIEAITSSEAYKELKNFI